MSKQRHIMIIADSATGSSAIFDQLLNNKHVFKHNNKEPLNITFSANVLKNRRIVNGTHWYSGHILEYIKEAEAEGKKLVMHVKPSHLPKVSLMLSYVIKVLSHKFDFVRLNRSNYLAMAFSLVAKENLKEETKLLGTDINFIPKTKLRLPRGKTIRKMDRTARYHKELDVLLASKKCVNISYEDEINVDLRAAVDRITTELGFYDDYVYTGQHVNYNSVKNKWSEIPLRDKIENFDQITELLAGTTYEWMLRG